jgi:tetratricopeptide (TPR) repeat protein
MKRTREEQDVQVLEELFERYRQSPESHVFAPLADAYRKLGRLDDALEICEAGIKRHPVYPSGFVVRGKCFYDRGDQSAAKESFERVLLLDENNLVALKYLGIIEADDGNLSAARKHLKRILTLDPDNKEIKTIVRLFEEEERAAKSSEVPCDTMEAVDEILEVKQPEPGQEDDKEEPAAALSIESELAEKPETGAPAETASSPRAELETSDELASLTLADIFAAQGYRSKAEKIYREVLRRQPANDVVRARLEGLTGQPVEAGATGEEPNADSKARVAEPPLATPEENETPHADEPKPRDVKSQESGEEPQFSELVEERATPDRRRPEIDEKDSLNHFKHWVTRFQK